MNPHLQAPGDFALATLDPYYQVLQRTEDGLIAHHGILQAPMSTKVILSDLTGGPNPDAALVTA
jgi:hypothetical protein